MLRAVYPVISRLALNTGEAVVLHLRSGPNRVLILGVPAPSGPIVDPAGLLGERSPLVAGASGRIILAFLPDSERSTMDLDGLNSGQLDAIRDRGYEISYGENHPGINGISAPLLAYPMDGAPPTVFGAITVAGPASRLGTGDLSRVLTPLLGACRDLAPRLASILGPDPGAVISSLDL